MREYTRKRRTGKTPEPAGQAAEAAASGPLRFVIQRHSARALHFDVRLEHEGVLRSWAVPKGLPMAHGIRRLAVHTEDHPLAYLDFHGVIPEGQYGAGVMDVYARGTYEVVKDHGKRGFTVRLQSERLRGDWTLVPAELDGKERNWLMFRSDDGAPGTAQHAPMLATMDDAPPRGSGWTHEIKWDGHRVLARLSSGEATLWSRTGKDATARFPKIAADLGRGLRSFECVVDGEVCALDAQGRPSFQLLQSGEGTLAYAVFDVLEEDGRDLTDLPLSERRERLEALVDETWPLIRLSRGFDDGAGLLAAAREQGLEGIVSKRLDSRYAVGRRTGDWRKIKVRRTATFAIGGHVKGEGARERMGALVIGARDGDDLVYAGRVGTGFTDREIGRLLAALEPLQRATSPFDQPVHDPRLRKGRVVWAEPELRCLVEFVEWTRDGRVRAPAYKGLSDEEITALAGEARIVVPTGDVAAYYAGIAPAMFPHVRGRVLEPGGEPLDGDEDGWAERLAEAGTGLRQALAHDDDPEQPDCVLFELRPRARRDAASAQAAALHVREAIAGIGLEACAKTAEACGIDVAVPIERTVGFEATRAFARAVAAAVERAYPALAAAIETGANADGGTMGAPYALLASPSGAVSCPLDWEEIEAGIDPAGLTPEAVLERFDRLGDLFAPALSGGQRLDAVLG